MRLAHRCGDIAIEVVSSSAGLLRAHAMHLGKPALLYEGGEAHRLDDMHRAT